jgi:acyl-CoA reductase-like NAD-dependent aldehyde dehydrogenase
LRKVLVPALAASAAAVPAVAFAATTDNQTQDNVALATTTPTHELRHAAHYKLVNAAKLAQRARQDAARKKARKLARKRAKERAQARKRAAATASVASPQLQAIAACESGGNPQAIGGGGAYRGKYQFDYGTWASVGGSGDPAAAPEAEQDRRAAILLQRSGTSPWPVCGQ